MKQLHVLQKRKIYYVISGILGLISIFLIFFGTLHYGIDMTGGTQATYEYELYDFNNQKVGDIARDIAATINEQQEVINTINTYKITGENAFIVETWFTTSMSEQLLDDYKIAYRESLSEAYSKEGDITLLQYTNIGASFGEYIRSTAKTTLLLAIIAIALYIAYSFRWTVWGISWWSFAWITLITLFHDVLIASGLYILISKYLSDFQIDTFFVTALLTILGYSINDTIVIFDRIRANLKAFWGKGKELEEIINLSINESFTRSIYTSATLIFVLICMLVWWPESIAGFTLAMLLGTIVGTYSSICIAAPLLYELNKNKTLTEYIKPDQLSEEDKMVV